MYRQKGVFFYETPFINTHLYKNVLEGSQYIFILVLVYNQKSRQLC
jgi:hypothetical protein